MYHTINQVIDKIDFKNLRSERTVLLDQLVQYIKAKREKGEEIKLHFICTHNSRRSQLGQIWAQVAASHYQVPIASFSGGMEVTEFNERAVNSLDRFGFRISHSGAFNKRYNIEFNAGDKSVEMFSKLVDDSVNPTTNFAAIMTCSDADEKCPFVSGCDVRIPLQYDDPKFFDGSPLEATMYDYRSFQIATEMFYVFSKVN